MAKVQDKTKEQRIGVNTKLLRAAASEFVLRRTVDEISNRQCLPSNSQRNSLKTLAGGTF